jgi:mRNA-degrading endonuclease RelE of RelBE toxin-antitoxin system
MTWHVDWDDIAEQNWQLLPPKDAERVAIAVDRFAKLREGDVELLSSEPRITCRLRVGSYLLELYLDESRSVVVVLWLIHRPRG